jgi:hypothetical protein
MHRAVLSAFLLGSAVLLVAGTAHAQVTLPTALQRLATGTGNGGARAREALPPPQQQPPTAAAPQVQPPPQPEPPKTQSVVEVQDGKLSVDLIDADLGAVISQIAGKLKIPAQISGSVYGKKITTKFSGFELDRGIRRLLSLAGETNYMINYNAGGKLSNIVLYSETAPSSIAGQQPAQPSPFARLRRYRRYSPPQPAQAVPAQPQAAPPAPRVIGP